MALVLGFSILMGCLLAFRKKVQANLKIFQADFFANFGKNFKELQERLKYSLLFGALGALFFMPFLGGVHLFDWDEINFAEISREMLLLKDYLRVYVDFEPFWEKPPFFFWIQALSMKVFGVGEYGARFPNAICGVVTLVILFNIGARLYNVRFGIIWAGVYLGTILPHLYFKSGIIDPWFNLFIFLGLYFFILFYWKKEGTDAISISKNKWYYLLIGGLWIGMGILTKGPVAFLIVCLCLFVYWVYKRFKFYISPWQFIVFTLASSMIMLAWYGVETFTHGPWFVVEFTKYQFRLFNTPDAGHAGFFGYHFIVLLVGCFPASIFCIRSFFKQPNRKTHHKDFKRWMLILFWVVLILFSIVKSKIVHYSSMCYFPLSYLAALSLYQIIQKEIPFARWMKASLTTLGILMGTVVIATPFIGMNIEMLQPLFASDPFALANLEADVHWSGLEALPGILLIILTLLGVAWLARNRRFEGFQVLFGGMAIFVMLTLIFFIGRVERYSQGAAITFFEKLQGKDVYVDVSGYKSYAQLFYTRKQPILDPDRKAESPPSLSELLKTLGAYTTPVPFSKQVERDWLLQGDIDKDVYMVARIRGADFMRKQETFEEVGNKNGFYFFRRKVAKPDRE